MTLTREAIAAMAIKEATDAGASYADCRAITLDRESVSTRNGEVGTRRPWGGVQADEVLSGGKNEKRKTHKK